MSGWNGNIAKISLPTPFAVGDVNVYIVKGDALTLIDAGVKTKEAWEVFQFQLAQLGMAVEDIDQVVLTHHHPDHVGFLEWLPDQLHILGHAYCVPWLKRDTEFFKRHDQFYFDRFQESGVEGDVQRYLDNMKSALKFASHRPLTQTLKEGEFIPGLNEWKVLETPGHAQSHLSFYRESDACLIAGDHILATISSNPLLEPPLGEKEPRPKPQLQYNHSLKKLLEYPIQLAYTGHGNEVFKVHDLVNRRIERQHSRALQVKRMIAEKPMTTFEICRTLFPAVYQKEIGLTISETTAQLDYLLSIEQAECQVNDQVMYFSAK
ncbi:MBL fold metallo-hydrolase [Heyndrickxia acidicola]|uniref:MBL fold metallo-hydrolase n=1 Tax=Heyndrickxia acidicola TaxID=209389 RepID=A0ABU6MPU4_9BACI|nr:MBL fold metallo-hydrolase [Heyndrickxia acidicola]MED1205247.1 MBL fold metallo-hydrolase [Heyndrickxia acidicola]